jgi:hypothetical protein
MCSIQDDARLNTNSVVVIDIRRCVVALQFGRDVTLTPAEIEALGASHHHLHAAHLEEGQPLHPYADAPAMQAQLDSLIATLNPGQRAAYDKAINTFRSYVELPDGETVGAALFMYLSGEGGTGKSQVIKALRLHARLRWGRTEGVFGPVAVVGPTGVAAYNVKGSTWQSVFGKTRSKLFQPGEQPGQELIKRLKNKLKGLKVVLFDEVSMLSWEELHELHIRCHCARDWKRPLSEPFAGIHIMFAGDLLQLPPVHGHPLYGRKYLPQPNTLADHGTSEPPNNIQMAALKL